MIDINKRALLCKQFTTYNYIINIRYETYLSCSNSRTNLTYEQI